MLAAYSFIIDRFIIAIVPFVIHYYIQGLYTIVQSPALHFTPKVRHIILLVLVSITMFSNVSHIAARLYQETHFANFAPEASDFYTIAKWARNNIPPGEAVITEQPYLFFIYSEHQTVTPSQVFNVGNQPVKYINIDTSHDKSAVEQWGCDAEQLFSQPLQCGKETQLCIYLIPTPCQSALIPRQ